MRLLFFPSDKGGGFGHLSRCVALASEAANRGHCCAFVLNDRKYEKAIRQQFKVYLVHVKRGWGDYAALFRHLCLKPFNKRRPSAFTEMCSLNYQAVRDGLTDRMAISNTLHEYSNAVDSFRPDALIGDTNLLAWMLGKKLGLPVVQIVRYASHPKTADLVWWKEKPAGLSAPDIAGMFNPVLSHMDASGIVTAQDLLRGDLYIVPSIPEIEPIPGYSDTFHVGHLAVKDQSARPQAIMFESAVDKPRIYVTIGGGAGHVGNKLFFGTVIDAFSTLDAEVIVSTSRKFDPKVFVDAAKNIRFANWLPGSLMISSSTLTVFHGGYGTLMETMVHGKPSVIIPFHTEQESNGRRLEQLGCGRVMKMSEEKLTAVKVVGSWGECSYGVQRRFDLEAGELRAVADTIIADPKYSDAAKALQRRVNDYGGMRQAIDLVEQHLD